MSNPRRGVCLRLFAASLLAVLLCPAPALAQSTPEYRAIWVETFNTPLGSRADIDKVIAAAVDARANAIFAQIRRRGDSWYIDTLEPLTQVLNVGEPNSDGVWTLDPLQYLIEQAHLRGIEVHAFVIIGSIYNAHPTITGLPRDPAHVFNQHFWDKSANALYPDSDPRQWSTRALPHNLANGTLTNFNGHRFTAAGEWYIDLGHPDAQAYTVNVLTHLVRKYAVDGVHLDRIRYPEAPIDQPAGGLTKWGINVGYNETSVNRFKARHGAAATYYTAADLGTNVSSAAAPAIIGAGDLGYPRTSDALWNEWRREQVTNFVRRLYLSATAVNPRIKLSAALICFWTGPVGSGGWERTEAYYRVFQDWRAWMQEGILDIAAPMIYKREHSAVERAQYDDWLAFTKSLAQSTGRHALPGIGNYINGVEGSLRQARRALARAPFASGNAAADGVIFYALGSFTAPSPAIPGSMSVNVAANPFSYPTPGLNTPKRTNADFFAALRTSASVAGTTLFEDPAPGPLFPSTLPTPDMPWKSTPTLGHMMGFATNPAGAPLDGAIVTLNSMTVPADAARTTRTDGGGFFGVVGLQPGTYRGHVEQAGLRLDVCPFEVTPGSVANADARPDTNAPVTTGAVQAADTATGANGWYLDDVRVTLSATDGCSGVARTEYSVDGGATWQNYSGAVAVTQEGTTVVSYRSVDAAGNAENAASLTVRIDKTNPVLTLTPDRTLLWPPNGQTEPVVLRASATDTVSGLAGVTYQVVDEYGLPFGIAPRVLTGPSAMWADTVALEARRTGADLDGREYRVIATVRDIAGRTAAVTVQVGVPHDRR